MVYLKQEINSEVIMKIGYQGIEGSNSEEAAINLAYKLGIKDYELIPLVSSKNVIGNLKRGTIDYAVVAAKNSLGGTVIETFEAIKNEYLELIATEILQIHHCIFKKNGIDKSDIKVIASHIQALKQTKENICELFPNSSEKEVEDTALAAKMLSEGILADNVAVICRKNAGYKYANLEMIFENVEDNIENFTEFRMFKMSEIDYDNSEKPTLIEAAKYQTVNESGLGYVSKFIMIFSIFISFYISKEFNLSDWDTAVFVGGYLSAIFLFLTSNKLRNNMKYQSIEGYWKYYSMSDSAGKEIEQKFDTPRLVKIEKIDNELVFHGFICDKENVAMFESTNVMISELGKSRGQLVYWYSNPKEINRGYALNGLVELNWTSKFPSNKINKMSGYYTGKATKDYGFIEYLRISEKEYNAHRMNDFL